jgi:hypothetical protein
MGLVINPKGGALPAGYTKPTISPAILKSLGFSHLWIADYAKLDAAGVLQWPDLVTGVVATPTQAPQYQPTKTVDGGVPCISMTSTDGLVCGFFANQQLGLAGAYTVYLVMDVGTVLAGEYVICSADYDNAFAMSYSGNAVGNLNVRHAAGDAATARSDENTIPKGTRVVAFAGWNSSRGSVIFGRNGQALQTADALATAPVNAATPFLLAQGPTSGDGLKGAKVFMIGIVPVDHTTDAYAADRANVIALAAAGYGLSA